MELSEKVKENVVGLIFGSAGSIIAIVVALFTVDARYAHAVDVTKDKLQTQDLIQDTFHTSRRLVLEDKIFELDVKKNQAKDGKLQPVDAALRERYQRQLDEITIVQTKSRNLNRSLPQN